MARVDHEHCNRQFTCRDLAGVERLADHQWRRPSLERLIEDTSPTVSVLVRQDIVVVLGAPGSGKGTQARALVARWDARHVSTGDLLRVHCARQSVLGRQAQAAMNCGALVPDDLVTEMVLTELKQTDANRVAILDGFPRTLAQAAALDAALTERGRRVSAALYLEVPGPVLIRRLPGRRVCVRCAASYHVTANPSTYGQVCDRCGGALEQRSDDCREVVAERIRVYLEQTLPLVDYYLARGLLHRVDGDLPIDDIHAELLNRLGMVASSGQVAGCSSKQAGQ